MQLFKGSAQPKHTFPLRHFLGLLDDFGLDPIAVLGLGNSYKGSIVFMRGFRALLTLSFPEFGRHFALIEELRKCAASSRSFAQVKKKSRILPLRPSGEGPLSVYRCAALWWGPASHRVLKLRLSIDGFLSLSVSRQKMSP